jgi:hypothetical protein
MVLRGFRFGSCVALPCLTLACAAPGNGSIPDEGEAIGSASLAISADATVSGIDQITVRVPKRFNVKYDGPARAEFPDGLPLSLGSGLRLSPERGCRCEGSRGEYTLIGLSDRGPNGDAPDYRDADGVKHASKSYLVPEFTPELVTVRVRRGAAQVTHTRELSFGRQPAVGLPPAAFTSEIGVDEALHAFASSEDGIDPEGLDFDARGDAWISEEYGPSLLKVNARTGRIVQRLSPSAGLPPILASRQVNRGFEGVAVTPSGKVYGLVQSTLDVDGKSKGLAQFIRLLELDPRTGATRMFAYPHDVVAYKKSGDAKMSDLFALDDTTFLTIESGKDKDGKLRNIVYRFDIASATDLTDLTLPSGTNAGKALEYGTAAELSSLITPAQKALVVDLRAYGYTAEKSEGLALVDDRTLVVINDNDFGATAVVENDPNSTDPTKYVVDSTGALSFNDAPSPGSYAIHPLDAEAQATNLFVVHLQEPFAGYCSR